MAAEQSTQTTPETWKPVVGYEGYYEVSDHGNVRSVFRFVRGKSGKPRPVNGRPRMAWTTRGGYLRVGLSANGETRRFMVHRLVLEAFTGPCPVGMEACHGDGNPVNNHLENLRWDTKRENMNDRTRHGNCWESQKSRCPRGHLLESPNLRTGQFKVGKRACLACSRARGYLQYHPDLKGNFQKISDSYYRVLMSPDA